MQAGCLWLAINGGPRTGLFSARRGGCICPQLSLRCWVAFSVFQDLPLEQDACHFCCCLIDGKQIAHQSQKSLRAQKRPCLPYCCSWAVVKSSKAELLRQTITGLVCSRNLFFCRVPEVQRRSHKNSAYASDTTIIDQVRLGSSTAEHSSILCMSSLQDSTSPDIDYR